MNGKAEPAFRVLRQPPIIYLDRLASIDLLSRRTLDELGHRLHKLMSVPVGGFCSTAFMRSMTKDPVNMALLNR